MKTKLNTKSVQIPFDGFYYSQADHIIGGHIESEIYYFEHEAENQRELDWSDFTVDFRKFAEFYVDQYVDYVANEYDIDLKLTFDELVQPREYNFTTDKIYCHVSMDQLETLYARLLELDRSEVQELIDERFKSRSGFASFYDEFCSEWKTKPLNEWDENELSILFPPVLDWWDVYEDFGCSGELYEFVTLNESETC